MVAVKFPAAFIFTEPDPRATANIAYPLSSAVTEDTVILRSPAPTKVSARTASPSFDKTWPVAVRLKLPDPP